ncbi:MAG: hypothetical protein V3T86_12870 [Planctomycetota bacterium]
MQERSDPLFPLLATMVSVVVLSVVVLVFLPRILRPGDGEALDPPPGPSATVPVWACRTVAGAALLLQAHVPAQTGFADAFLDGPYQFVLLTVHNFDGPDPVTIDFSKGLVSPEGGATLQPVGELLKKPVEPRWKTLLGALGTGSEIVVTRGRSGQMLLALAGDPESDSVAKRTVFQTGGLKFERREISRSRLAAWLDRPDWSEFEGF